MKNSIALFLLFIGIHVYAQNGYWQQQADYTLYVDMDHTNHQFAGTENISYTNNSPDTLRKIFYHLYFNAFQPGSMMDERSLAITDPDKRVGDRISKLKPNEIGYINVKELKLNGMPCTYSVSETVLEVALPTPIAPGETVNLDMIFEGQVPVQIRRSGRNNKEGIDYTMTQWYPKLAEYDKDGWHANPYVGREFYGVWGNFDVTIAIDEKYVVAGTGIKKLTQKRDNKKVWNFKAANVHDFAWAADPDYQHDSLEIPGLTKLHFYYQTDTLAAQWKEIQPEVKKLFEIMSAEFGRYPYPQFSVIQGGDGGMEYPMCTMILGHGKKPGKIGLIAHEAFHNWYYGVLATNEFRYPWMDEGFTSYAEEIVLDSLFATFASNPFERNYSTYRFYAQQPWEEPLSTPADFYERNAAYGINSYVKGAITLHQLSYVIGQDNLMQGMRTYFDTWKFKHPTPSDFLRVMEVQSDLELDWYFEYWVNSTKHIDYGIDTLIAKGKSTEIVLERIGQMPMPLDVRVELKDGTVYNYNIPLTIMRGNKPAEYENTEVKADWPWTYPTYTLVVDAKMNKIASVQIDPSGRMADIRLKNNVFPRPEEEEQEN